MPQVICSNCGALFDAQRVTAQFCSGRCRIAHHRVSVTSQPEPEVSVTRPPEPEVSVTYVIPAKPYVEKPFTFVQPKAVWGAELALKFTNAR
jgi:hypothetical protein